MFKKAKAQLLLLGWCLVLLFLVNSQCLAARDLFKPVIKTEKKPVREIPINQQSELTHFASTSEKIVSSTQELLDSKSVASEQASITPVIGHWVDNSQETKATNNYLFGVAAAVMIILAIGWWRLEPRLANKKTAKQQNIHGPQVLDLKHQVYERKNSGRKL